MPSHDPRPSSSDESRYRALLEGSIQGILIHRDFRPLFVNQAFATMFGYTHPEEVLQLDSLLVLIAPEMQLQLQRYVEARQRGDAAPMAYEFEGIHRDGSRRWFDNRVMVVAWEDEPAIQLTLIDITARKQMEAEHHRMEEHMHKMQRLTSLGTFAAGLAHDFNNFLAIILAHLEILMMLSPPEYEGWPNLYAILEAGQRAKELLQRLATLRDQHIEERGLVDLPPLIENLRTMLQPSLPNAVTLHTVIEPQVSAIMANATQIQQVLVNLCTNAAQAMQEGGTVEVHLSGIEHHGSDPAMPPELAPGTYVCLRVSDSGPGIAPHLRERIFEPFFTTKSEQGGERSRLGHGA